jgi:NB-ARC domain
MKEYPVYIGGFHQFTREQLAKAGVFIAHDFFGDDDTARGGYRNKFDVAFRDTPYMPVYAPIDSGTILETLTQSMVNCFAGIFDVTTNRRLNANVLIELGVCLAINHPAIVIAEGTDPLPDFLETLQPLRYANRRDLRDQLSQQLDERIAESQRLQHSYCAICRRSDCRCRTSVPMEDKTYTLLGAHGDVHDDEVDIDVEEALLHFDLKRLQIAAEDTLNLCEWLRLIKRVRFAFFYSKSLGKAHHGDENAATMVQLGLAVGSPTPWRIIVPVDEFPPTDVGAFMAVIRNPNARIFQDRISGAASKLLEEFNPLRVVNTAVNRPGIEEWLEDDSERKRELTSLSLPQFATLYNVPPLPTGFVKRQDLVDAIVGQIVSPGEHARRLAQSSMRSEAVISERLSENTPEQTVLTEKFRQAEAQVRTLRTRFQSGEISRDEMQSELRQHMVLDESRNWWMMGIETDTWYRYENAGWVAASNDISTEVAVAAGIVGMGGVGKTSLAVAVCHDERVRRAFADGIFWLHSGENFDNLDAVLTLVQVISNETIASASLPQAAAMLAELVHNQSILIVIDDVRNVDTVQSIVVPSPRSSYLLTTRNSEVLQQLNASITRLERLSEVEAIQLLTTDIAADEIEGNLPSLRELAQRVGYHPLTLKLLNGQLRQQVQDGRNSSDAIQMVREQVGRTDTPSSLSVSLWISIRALPERTRHLFEQLGVFLVVT